jgi:hypothetical protein
VQELKLNVRLSFRFRQEHKHHNNWAQFLRRHKNVLRTTDFSSAEAAEKRHQTVPEDQSVPISLPPRSLVLNKTFLHPKT